MGAVAVDDSAVLDACDSARGWKLWLYTNYDCNLRCSYCVARSGPNVPRRVLPLASVRRLIDEAVALGFAEVFFTGGEPFLLPDICEQLAYASARLKTTVLTNAMLLLHEPRRARLRAVANPNLFVQVSLDGATAEVHDAYRGKGSWAKTVESLRVLLAEGFAVRIGTTETPVNSPHLDALRKFVAGLGIPPEAHFVRPLARRGYSKEGLELELADLEPELTINLDGVYWHPLSTDQDMLIRRELFPLRAAVERVQEMLATPALRDRPRRKFR